MAVASYPCGCIGGARSRISPFVYGLRTRDSLEPSPNAVGDDGHKYNPDLQPR